MGFCSICGEHRATSVPIQGVLDACEVFFGLQITTETRLAETCVFCDQPWFDLENMAHRIQDNEREKV